MQTKLLRPSEDPTAIEQAGALLRAGEVVGIPTETVYGLAADALNPQAVARIFEAKGRPQDNPLIVHIAEIETVHEIAADFPPEAQALAEAYWPGPMTIILPKLDRIPMVTSGGLNTVGIRFPSHPMAQAIIRAAGTPLAAPSANTSGRPSTTTAQHVMEDLNGKIAAVVDGGACSVGVESTVVSLCGERPRLLRPGGISLEQLRAVLGEVDVDRALREKIDDSEKVSAPGMKYRHYAPKAPVTVVFGTPKTSADYIYAQLGENSGVLCFDDCAARFQNAAVVETFGPSDDPEEQAREVFDALRRFDETDCTEIYAQCPPSDGIGLAVANRIKKAAGFHIIDLTEEEA
ncbi:L-threonylcarbamoyladenylate synthase [Butyricicoccus porcorum]|uniref:Threonylcarbamoyl-AMP synthase n=1 Tax=Butyricicoccus porcorum TaxID=1945634 RepID=A0A252F4N0_9FIRM|nr:L-threonylcarbamoyladenylate synthase [Butyricicoccus porcorum]OUM20719.1 threonylcarbamoyl-AMP synthase [Butyricicoccus porcorum]